MTETPLFPLSIDLERLFADMPFEQRLEQLRDQKLDTFEFGSPKGKDMLVAMALQRAFNLKTLAFTGITASLIDPAARPSVQAELHTALALAQDLQCSFLVTHGGTLLAGQTRAAQRAAMVTTLRTILPLLEGAHVTLLLAPQNPREHEQQFLTSVEETCEVLRALNTPYVRLLFDLYEQQVHGGNLSARLTACLPYIGHIRIADAPNRSLPGTGEINVASLLQLLHTLGYQGHLGLSFLPTEDSAASIRTARAAIGL